MKRTPAHQPFIAERGCFTIFRLYCPKQPLGLEAERQFHLYD